MITLTNLEKIYRTKEIETVALENVNLTVNKGEFLSIIGPSGFGKSTLLNIIGLLDAPTSGTVEIAGINTINMNDKQLAEFRNQKLGFVFQSFHLINSLNVLDNVELPLLYRKVSAKERREAAVAVEPTGNLDSKMGAEVMELLHKLNKEDGRTIVMVTHNEEQARQTSRTVRFFDGRQVM